MAGFRAPAATYRFQFHHNFRFVAAQNLVPYLSALGVSDIYASPLFRARRRSLHGYSVTNPLVINPELGSKDSFRALARALKSRGMGLLLDIVPNHMALSHDNPWWLDLLENGPASPFAVFFDVDWCPPNRLLEGRVLQPILGAPYDQVLENQEIKLELKESGFAVHYYDHTFPLDPKTYHALLTHRLDDLTAALGTGNPAISSLWGLITLVEHLPPRTVTSKGKLRERNRQKEILKENLWRLYQENQVIKEFLDDNLAIFNGRPGDPASFNLLDSLLDAQAYRLAHWRVALEMINYRRFFSINDLIGLRVEDPQVFEASHSLQFTMARDGRVTGLRIDHIDGLYDPLEYLQRLQNRLAQESSATASQANFFVVVEKILEKGETLPPEWPVAGTTGYDFLTMLDGLFVDRRGLEEIQQAYARFTGTTLTWPDIVYDNKKLIMASLFGGEVENLGYYLGLLAAQDRTARDIPAKDLNLALFEVTACLPVYRTYIRSLAVSPQDRVFIEHALMEVRQRQPTLNPLALDFLKRVLFLDVPPVLTEEQKKDWLNFVMRWQQFTGPIMAKGLEDTASYVYNPLVSLNEVGGCFQAVSPEAFHHFNQQKQQSWPFTLNATSTHDTKRSEDVRMRLHVLSELPGEWDACLRRWSGWNRTKKHEVDGVLVPDASQEALIYQTMLGAWPLNPEEIPEFKDRLESYIIKAAREAKVHTRWIAPHLEHERALATFVRGILEESAGNDFLSDFQGLQTRLAWCGALNSLSQVLLKIASPGVPDFYQGTELWDLSLVDPDNRRPVDFRRRSQLLKGLQKRESQGLKSLIQELLDHWGNGALKLFVTFKALNFRRTHLDLFHHGDYLPLTAAGEKGEHLVALARRHQNTWALAVAGRFFAKLSPQRHFPLGEKFWGQTALSLPPEAPSEWRNIFTDEIITASLISQTKALHLKDIFQELPVALLCGRPG